ncbi:MAG: MmcB family DNA repair protein [Sphingobium sp.]
MSDMSDLSPRPDLRSALSEAPAGPLQGAAAITRGVGRLFQRHDIFTVAEMPLRNNRRADLMGLSKNGDIVIVEIKCARGDLLGDAKWTDYLDYCDRFYWAVCPEILCDELHQERFLPERTGLIVADAYDAEILRPAALTPLAASRRKVETLRLARQAMRRLTRISDPGLPLIPDQE